MNIEEILGGLDALYAAGQTAEAGAYLEKWLQRAREARDREAELALLSELTGFWRSVGRSAESIAAGERALEILSALGVDAGGQLAAALVNLATAYRAAGDTEKALPLYARAEAALSAGDGGSYEAAALYNNLGGALAAAGEPARALSCMERSLGILSGLDGTAAERATALAGIGAMQLSLSRLEEARESLARSVALFESLPGEDPHYPSALAALGRLRYMEGQLEAALELFSRAAERTEAVFGRNRDYITACRNCALICRRLERTAEAERFEALAAAAAPLGGGRSG